MATSFQEIQHKLKRFTDKYYQNELIKGAILFTSLGALYFITILLTEHFFWMGQKGRLLLFWAFILVEALLFIKFIAIPLATLFRYRRGIDHLSAAKIIGTHFSQVGDKLVNILQLAENNQKTDLLLASIAQKSEELRPVPFSLAINFKKNLTYAKYALPALIIFLIVWFSGNLDVFSGSYKRVVRYDLAFEKPAPFSFKLMNEKLHVIEGESILLEVETVGSLIPEEVKLHNNNQFTYMQSGAPGKFQLLLNTVTEDVTFYLEANNVFSKEYLVEVIKAPKIENIEMELKYPAYIGKSTELIKGTGNASVPEGTTITWALKAVETDSVFWNAPNTKVGFIKSGNGFLHSKKFVDDVVYEISTSNSKLKDFERLGYQIKTVKDQFPEIKVELAKDSLTNQALFFVGQYADDYGIMALRLVYHKQNNQEDKKTVNIPLNASDVGRFWRQFPGGIQLEEGQSYVVYFEVTDNDAVNGNKTTRSDLFSFRKLTGSEEQEQQLYKQNQLIQGVSRGIEKIENQQDELKNITQSHKEKNQLSFADKKKVDEFIKRQAQQEQLMQRFTNELKNSLDKIENTENIEQNLQLKERLERQQLELKRNEKLLNQLEELQDKISKEDLTRKLEEFAKNQKANKRNLEQVLELTKRYYVTAKLEKVANDLQKLSDEQNRLSDKELSENTKEKQENVNNQFEQIKKGLDNLEKENEKLRKPIELERDPAIEKSIENNLEKATETLEKENRPKQQPAQNQSGAKAPQKAASQQMKKMSQNLSQGMAASGAQAMQEDAQMLRQILDNLVEFSKDEEKVMVDMRNLNDASPGFAKLVNKQHQLKELFTHVDDSLFALSLRRPEISESINKNVVEVYTNIDLALERFQDNQLYQGMASQQFAFTGANELADFLSNTLDNMQQSMSSGSGGGGGMQLPDIIQSQEQLNQKMQEGMQQQQGNKPKPDENGEKKSGEKNDENPEENARQVLEILREQQQIRQALEQQLKSIFDEKSIPQQSKNLLKEMEGIESQLLENGLNSQALRRMQQLKHELLKLEKAAFQQGQDNRRESNTGKNEFQNTSVPDPKLLEQYFKQTEILNRQALPLRLNYKQKVQEYFKGND